MVAEGERHDKTSRDGDNVAYGQPGAAYFRTAPVLVSGRAGVGIGSEVLAFLGNSDAEARESLCMASPAAVNTMGMWDLTDAATEQHLETVYMNQTLPTALLPPTAGYGDGNLSNVFTPIFLEVENAMVHIYADLPHPFVALQRVKFLEQLFTNHANLEGFMMHTSSGCAGRAMRARQEEQACWPLRGRRRLLFGNDALLEAAQARYNLLLPPSPTTGGAQPVASGMTEQQVRG